MDNPACSGLCGLVEKAVNNGGNSSEALALDLLAQVMERNFNSWFCK